MEGGSDSHSAKAFSSSSHSKKFSNKWKGKKPHSVSDEVLPPPVTSPALASASSTAPAPPSSTPLEGNNKSTKGPGMGNKVVVPKVRVIIRKLPASRDYRREQFDSCLEAVAKALDLDIKHFFVEHFIEGKISRKRGPVSSAGFVSISDPQASQVFLQQCPLNRPFLSDDLYGQPEVTLAPYAKAFKQKEKVDKIVNTYESDPEFALFQQRLAGASNPASSSSANTPTTSAMKGGADDVGKSSSAMTLEEKLKTNPLLQFLRDRAEKRLRVKSVLSSKKGKGMVTSSSSIIASANENMKSKSKKNKKKKEKEAKAAALKGKDGENVGEDGKKKKKKRSSRSEKKVKAGEMVAVSGEGGGSTGFSVAAAEFTATNTNASNFPSGSGGGAGSNPKGPGGPRKLMILKRDPRPSEPPAPPSDAIQPPLSTSPLSGMGGGYVESGGHGGRGGGGQGGKRFRRGPPAKGPPSKGPPHSSFSPDPSNH
eukprot:gene11378-12708_t